METQEHPLSPLAGIATAWHRNSSRFWQALLFVPFPHQYRPFNSYSYAARRN